MTVAPAALLGEVLSRLAYLGRLRAAALQLTRAGAPRDRLRASGLATAVAAALGLQDSPWFRRDLAAALHAAGWRSVACGNVRMWKGRLMR